MMKVRPRAGRNRVAVAERANDTMSVKIPAIVDASETTDAGTVDDSVDKKVPGPAK